MSKDGNYILEYGRSARIQCVSTIAGYLSITKTNKTGSFTSKMRELERCFVSVFVCSIKIQNLCYY